MQSVAAGAGCAPRAAGGPAVSAPPPAPSSPAGLRQGRDGVGLFHAGLEPRWGYRAETGAGSHGLPLPLASWAGDPLSSLLLSGSPWGRPEPLRMHLGNLSQQSKCQIQVQPCAKPSERRCSRGCPEPLGSALPSPTASRGLSYCTGGEFSLRGRSGSTRTHTHPGWPGRTGEAHTSQGGAGCRKAREDARARLPKHRFLSM